MQGTITQQLLSTHLVEGTLEPGQEAAIRIDQTLTQDATGTLVMLELEAMGLDRVKTDVSVQYVDHNLLQEDHKNPDDHLFLYSACQRFGVWFSRPGNGVSHPVHMQRFAKPGASLLGSDSHTPASGAVGALAIGAGGIEVALAMAGQPYFLTVPRVWSVRLEGQLPDWCSAKDVILELLRRHGVRAGRGWVIEYSGPGLEGLDVWDRHVLANMGTELGATTSVLPADGAVWRFLRSQHRTDDYTELLAEPGAQYDFEEVLDLSTIEPMIAKPSSPGNVVPVREVAGEPIYQAYLGSSANPGYRDFAMPALMLEDAVVHPKVSFDVNPSTRSVLDDLARDSYLATLLQAGARLHQTGCNGCIGMGQAPATGKNSLRTVPRNFPGRSGTSEDRVWLCSPETATASALTGHITDPRTLGPAPKVPRPPVSRLDDRLLISPLSSDRSGTIDLMKGPNIRSLPELEPLPEDLELTVALRVDDDISTDEIMPAGSRILPYRSNVQKISDFCFESVDGDYVERARGLGGPHAIVAGANYGQGSSREHAAIAPRVLGLRAVLATSFARIHHQNLVNFGVLPLTLEDAGAVHGKLAVTTKLRIPSVRDQLAGDGPVVVEATTDDGTFEIRARHDLSRRQREVIAAGSIIAHTRQAA